jgi:hypothetical protein
MSSSVRAGAHAVKPRHEHTLVAMEAMEKAEI